MTRKLVLGSAVTGAKFTPTNHAPTGNPLIDLVSTGETIKSDIDALAAEAASLYSIGVRYHHYHARNPVTHEQTTSNAVYSAVSYAIQDRLPGMILSFGASRNGPEVRQAIEEQGEWERVSQSALPIHLGGAHFVTKQAAVELQIVLDLERQGTSISREDVIKPDFAEAVRAYVPSHRTVPIRLETNSTKRGGNYGSTAPAIQLATYVQAVNSRRRFGLLHEIEWVQLDRSFAMTRFAIEHPEIQLGSAGQLNITLLFGFSPRFPFPKNYSEFREVVKLAKSLEYDSNGIRSRTITIAVGSAVIPQQANEHIRALEFGPRAGELAGPLERIVNYSAQPDSQVDIIRFGMEDTPYLIRRDQVMVPSDNLNLGLQCVHALEECGVELVVEPSKVRRHLAVDTVNSEQRLCKIAQ